MTQRGTEAEEGQRKDEKRATTSKAETSRKNRHVCLFRRLRRSRQMKSNAD